MAVPSTRPITALLRGLSIPKPAGHRAGSLGPSWALHPTSALSDCDSALQWPKHQPPAPEAVCSFTQEATGLGPFCELLGALPWVTLHMCARVSSWPAPPLSECTCVCGHMSVPGHMRGLRAQRPLRNIPQERLCGRSRQSPWPQDMALPESSVAAENTLEHTLSAQPQALEAWGSSGHAQDTLTRSTWGSRAPP